MGKSWNGSSRHEVGRLRTAGEDDKSYPKTFGNPMWFIVHQDLMRLLLKGLLGEDKSNKKALLETLETEI